jgi:hypothetical protein
MWSGREGGGYLDSLYRKWPGRAASSSVLGRVVQITAAADQPNKINLKDDQ